MLNNGSKGVHTCFSNCFQRGFPELKADQRLDIFQESQGNIFLIIMFYVLKLQIKKLPLRKLKKELTTATG